MFHVSKWATPFVAFALLLSLTTAVRAQEAAVDAKKETGSVSGTVLDKDGNAAPGVQVRLFHPFERGQRRGDAAGKAEKQNADATAPAAPADKEGKPAKGDKGDKAGKNDRPKPVATTSTDKDGKFTIADVPVGKYVVMTMVRGAGAARGDVEVTAGAEAKVELKLKDRPAKGEKKGQKKGDAPAAAE
jgi:hypothetical protein